MENTRSRADLIIYICHLKERKKYYNNLVMTQLTQCNCTKKQTIDFGVWFQSKQWNIWKFVI